MINTTEVQIDQAELERRLADYTGTEAFERGIEAMAEEYRALRLPVPPYEVLRYGEVQEARKCLENLMIREAKGHLGKEKADPENGTSTLTCRRCGAQENLQR